MLHLTIEQKEGLATLKEKIKDIPIAMLSTIDASRKSIHGRPMATLKSDSEDAPNELWFFTYSNSEKAWEIEHDPHIGLLYVDAGSDLYISVSGEAKIVDDFNLVKKKWEPGLKAWLTDTYENPNVVLLRIRIGEVEYWDSKANIMVKLFSLVKEMVSGKPSVHTKHQHIDMRKQ